MAEAGQIGCLGDIPFIVSYKQIQTINKVVWSGSARYATHQRHLNHALTEFVGLNPDAFSFNMTLTPVLGVPPQQLLNQLWKYERNGTAVPLCIGAKAYGKYRWTVQKHTAQIPYFDGMGNALLVDVSVDLLEYLKE